MSVSTDTLKLLVRAGLSGDALIEVVEAIDRDHAKPARSKNAERQARFRERQKEQAEVVTTGVISNVTDNATVAPEEKVSPEPPSKTQTPGISPPIVPPVSAAKPAKPDDVAAAFELWNETAALCGLPRAKVLDQTRRRAIRQRLESGGLELWREAMDRVQRSAFLRGKRTGGDGRVFKADLTFVCQAKSYQRLVDGGYGDDAEPPGQPPAVIIASPAEQARRVRYFRDTGEWPEAWGHRPEERAA